MEKEKLEQLIKDGLSSHQIADKLKKSQTTIRYWLKKFDLKTNHLSLNQKEITDYSCTKSHRIGNQLSVIQLLFCPSSNTKIYKCTNGTYDSKFYKSCK